MNVGLIGPSRSRNGTGPFVAHYLLSQGAAITAVCASSQASANAAAAKLASATGSTIRAFSAVPDMLDQCVLDAVAICSPLVWHERHLLQALAKSVDVFCEKPLLAAEAPGVADQVSNIAREFKHRKLVLYHNTPWTFVLSDIRALVGERAVHEAKLFEMYLAPPDSGPSMFWEAIPHPVSLLAAFGATGQLSDISVSSAAADHLCLQFKALRNSQDPLAVRIILKAKSAQPRPCHITFDELRIEREVLSMDPYRLGLRIAGRSFPIRDPLERSVESFLGRCATRDWNRGAATLAVQFQIIEALRSTVSNYAA